MKTSAAKGLEKGGVIFRFRLYVAGDAPNGAQAVANISAICAAHLAGRFRIETIDVTLEPQRALAESIFMTPTLLKLEPTPGRRIVGTLSDTAVVMQALGLVMPVTAGSRVLDAVGT